MSITTRVRQLVKDRDDNRCVRCGQILGPHSEYSIHHRRPRGMGGSRRETTDQPANLLLLCGSGTTGCHNWVERNRTLAALDGLLVRSWDVREPSEVPVLTHRGWLLLDDDGNIAELEEQA